MNEMTGFIIVSLVLAVIVLGLVLRPLWRDRPAIGVGLLLSLVLSTGLVYSLVGTPASLDPARRVSSHTFAEAIANLEAELARNPDQIEGWRLLANTYASIDRPQDAQAARMQALKLAPDDADLLTQIAEARSIAAPDRIFDAEGVAMLQRALAQQPMHQHARWFLGIAQRQARQPAEAAKTWEPLLGVVDPETVAGLREQINAARADAGLEPLAPAAEVAAATANLTISVSLDPALAMGMSKDAVVFVIARPAGGPPMPVAVRKLPAASLPQVIILNDTDSLMPTTKLSQLQTIEITARVSASGDAAPRKGDFEAVPATVQKGQSAAVLIDRVVE
jgi:cytochrome c-type biogenesis protein CcmH